MRSGRARVGSGEMYSGAIENGQMHGQGRLQYANNDVFEVRAMAMRALPSLALLCGVWGVAEACRGLVWWLIVFARWCFVLGEVWLAIGGVVSTVTECTSLPACLPADDGRLLPKISLSVSKPPLQPPAVCLGLFAFLAPG